MKVLSSLFLLVLFLVFPCYPAFSQTTNLLKGIEDYKEENFEEALESLIEARKEDPSSSLAAFYLGLTYKQLLNYKEAATNFRDAVTLKPKIKEAVIELIEMLYNLNELKEAKEWLNVAEKEDIKPAQTAFLKGLILLKENKNLEAIKAFERSKEIDKTYTQAADFQIGNAYLKERRLAEAKESFKAVVIVDPNTDLAAFARQYEEAITKRLELMEKVWRFSVGLTYQYDDNVISRYTTATPDIPSGEDHAMVATFSAAYVPQLTGPWGLNAQYSLYTNTHRRLETHDVISHTIAVAPGYNFKDASLNLLLSYNHTWVNSKEYMSGISASPTLSIALGPNYIGQFSLGYNKKDFLLAPTDVAEDRDANVFSASVAYIYLFLEGKGFLNLKYEISKEDTNGENWDYSGNKGSINILIPLKEYLKINVTGEVFHQDYKSVNTFTGPGAPTGFPDTPTKRRDKTYTASGVLSYEFYKGANFIIQYAHIRDDSNIAVYDYERNIYSAGIEYRF
ncbi:MAG: tetratricopeptide repeat protein [Nitrospirae bacterium]|nr:tetratricopeptide repeat protein [Nitrospirota bacterium]